MGAIQLHRVTKAYAPGTNVVDDISLEVADGEFLVLVGPSGCGKSTLLRMIAGIEPLTAGQICIDDRDVTDALPRDRDVALIFQSYALYPHKTVFQNLAFALKLRKVRKPEIERRVRDVMTMLRLQDYALRKPGALSGGQRQRVAMGRAMVREPAVFLMDEPLSNLDTKLRVAMRGELARLHERLRITTVYVTHDQTEAMTLGNRIAVLRDGVLQQVDTPHVLFNSPANLFVAGFIGSPTINLVRATVRSCAIEFAGYRIPVPDGGCVPDLEDVIVGIRPTDFLLADAAPPGLPRLTATIEVVEDLGTELFALFPVNAPRIDVDSFGGVHNISDDERLLADDGRSLFTARIEPGHRIRSGNRVELAIQTSRLKFFDPATGLAVRSGQPLQPGVTATA